MEDVVNKENRSVTQPASRVMLGGGLALIGGLASNVIIAAIYGAGANMDAFLTAMVIPGYFQIVFYSSLAFVFIPAFIEIETNQGEEAAWGLVGTFFWFTCLILFSIAIVGALFSIQLINLIAPGFQSDKAVLAAKMLTVLMFTVPVSGLYTFTLGIQNIRNKFFWPSVAPAFGAFSNVFVLLILSAAMGPMALCWGYLASTLVQAGMTVIPILQHGWQKMTPLNDPRVKQIAKLALPLILFGMITSFSSIAERYFSSGLPDGQIAYIGYANKISNIFVTLLASGIAAAIFPLMARTYVREGIRGLSKTSDFGLRLTFALALPTTLIAGTIATPLVRIFFERGIFTPTDTHGVSRIVLALLVGEVFFRMVGNIFQRSFYVLKDTYTQPIVSTIFLALFILAGRFIVTRWGYLGLVWAGVWRYGLTVLVFWILLMRKFPQPKISQTLTYFLKYGSAALAASACAYFTLQVLDFAPALIQLAFSGSLSVALYFAILYAIDREMLTMILEVVGVRLFFEKFEVGRSWLFRKKS